MPIIDFYSLYTLSEAAQAAKVGEIVNSFPGLFERSEKLWVKYLAGVQKGIYSSSEKRDLYKWFLGVVDIWEKIAPNWTTPNSAGMLSSHKVNFAARVNRWAADVKGSSQSYGLSGLGLAPLVVGGIWILFGLASLAAAIGWIISSFATMEEEDTKQALIKGKSDGTLSDPDYQAGMAQYENRTGNSVASMLGLGDVSTLFKYGLVAAGVYLAWPFLTPLVKKLTGGGRG